MLVGLANVLLRISIIYSALEQVHNSFEQGGRKSSCPIAVLALPSLLCVAEFSLVGLTVTHLDLCSFCRGLEFHFLLTNFQITYAFERAFPFPEHRQLHYFTLSLCLLL